MHIKLTAQLEVPLEFNISNMSFAQREPFICPYLIVKNKEVAIERYF
jgi:hypothetical protein